MKSITRNLAALATLGVALIGLTAKADTIHYSSNQNASINFDGASHFNFTPSVNSFTVTLGAADVIGLKGDIGGLYTIGAVTIINPSTQTATVSGTGSFVIHDGLGFNLTSTLNWIDITTISTSGNTNISGTVNMTNISYSGTKATLLALASAGSASNVLSFSFVPGKSVTTLKSASAHTAFSGDITYASPDGGTTVMLMGLALAGLALIRRKQA